MLGGADNPNGELLSYIIGADTVTVSPQVVADWLHSTCWQSVALFRLAEGGQV